MRFSHFVSVFHEAYLPEQEVMLAGYSAIIKTYDLALPLPDTLAAISHKHSKYQKNHWIMFTPRHAPKNTLFGHLTFALKYEGINLLVLKKLFDIIQPEEIVQIVQLEPTSSYARRIWFLYEWLQETVLNLPDIKKGAFVNVVDDALQFSGPIHLSKRHHVRNNMPGLPGFCPMIRKTETLMCFINMNLSEQVQKNIGSIHKEILMRVAAFMLLKDSKASYSIEGETPPQTRAERWAKAIGQAGTHPLSNEEFLRLQEIVISDFRFIHYGYRNEGGFIGEHERGTGFPIPDHISARPKDLISLMDNLIKTSELLKTSDFDPVLAAAMIAFGFVFIHPFADGNGRIHRYLIHHILAEKHFTSKTIVFPVSAVILEHIEDYKNTLESYSKPRLPYIKWKPTEKGNVDVLNETIDLYRYFDVTHQAEFLYKCIEETINKTLPEEISYLQKYDNMKHFVNNYLDMPDRLVDLLIRFLIQENGRFSKRAKEIEFKSLTEIEIKTLENKFSEIFLNE